ncbi:MAG: HEAT repeat domain-containing protein [Gemmatimonadaceae bacterium]|nr:HEAT repeat domain-containing protein [Gemmatimonadaceae bacterium]
MTRPLALTKSLHAMWALAAVIGASTTQAATQPMGAQGSLDARIQAVRNGTIRFTLAASPFVCGTGSSWYRSRDGRSGSFYGNWNSISTREVETTCDRGPVRIVVVREDGDTKSLRHYVGGKWVANDTVKDFGAIGAIEGGTWLLRQAEQATDKVARTAMNAAILVDSTAPGPTLLRMVKDDSRSRDVRNSAVHWLGEVVGDRVTATLDSIAYESGDREIRRAAIMAMSRRPKEEAIPALQKWAESLPDRELRRTAIMALAQTRDTLAIAWLEKRMNASR